MGEVGVSARRLVSQPQARIDFGLYLDGTLSAFLVGAAVARLWQGWVSLGGVGGGKLGQGPRTHNQVLITSGFNAYRASSTCLDPALSPAPLSQPACLCS